MRFPRLRHALIACTTALLVTGSASESYALCDWLCSWLHPRGTAVTTYTPPFASRPVVAAPVAAAAPTMCSYVPQTAYRTVYRPVPVTTCQAMTACDPCTGCPVTTFRPVTAYAYRAQLVPYTTYRMVCSTPCVPSCNPCGGLGASSVLGSPSCPTCVPASGAPALSPMPSSAPSSGPATMPGPIAPGATGGSGGTSILSGGLPSTSGSTTPPAGSPTYAPPAGGGTPPAGPVSPYAPKTSGSGSFYGPGLRLRPLPSSATPSAAPAAPPQPPAASGRTAARTVVPASFVQPEPVQRSTVTGEPLDVGGWQPVR